MVIQWLQSWSRYRFLPSLHIASLQAVETIPTYTNNTLLPEAGSLLGVVAGAAWDGRDLADQVPALTLQLANLGMDLA